MSDDGRCWVELICRFSTRILRSKAPKILESHSLELVQEVESLQSRSNLVGEWIPLVNGIVFSMVAAELTFAASILQYMYPLAQSDCGFNTPKQQRGNLVGEEILCVSSFFFGDAPAASAHVSSVSSSREVFFECCSHQPSWVGRMHLHVAIGARG